MGTTTRTYAIALSSLCFVFLFACSKGSTKRAVSNGTDPFGTPAAISTGPNPSITNKDGGPISIGAGNGTNGLSAEQANAFDTLADDIAANAPNATTPIPAAAQQLLDEAAAAAKSGNLAQALSKRAEAAGEMIKACQEDIQKLTPQPGEPLLGIWAGVCVDTGATILGLNHGKYNTSSGGQPAGPLTLILATLDTSGESFGAGVAQVSCDGKAQGVVGTSQGSVYAVSVTDQPEAFTGQGTLISGGNGTCPMVAAKSIKSYNPIPGKYDESMKRLGQCYTQAMVMISPILSDYINNLSASAAQKVVLDLNLQ